ncbi:MAG: protein kinase [Vicinamibacterales bacterium]
MPLSPGERLNGYEIVALLGAGGMGEVYRARDTRLQRDVALKVLPVRLAADDAAFARFQREAQAVAALSHPNILAVFDGGQSGPTHYVVFELLQGASLRERLEQGPLPVRKAVDYARQTADGLAAAHGRGIIHRDIKPDNLFVTDDGRLKILDFGLAQSAAVAHASDASTGVTTRAPITDAGTVLGTVGYMAPEQVRGQAVDHRADIFALGATLFEMCTGTRAFKGATAADTMSAVLSADPPEFVVAGQTPPALERIVRRCLEKQPAERFQSARDLAFALESLSHLSAPSSGSTPAIDAPPANRGGSATAAIAAAVALALGVAAGAWLWRGHDAAPVPQAPPLRAEFPSTVSLNTSMILALSPDGRWLAYSDVAPDTGVRHVFVRELATGVSTRVENSDDGYPVSWSPRSDAVLFTWHGRELRQFLVADRTSATVVSFRDAFRGATWLDDGTIVAALSGDAALVRVSRNGETTTPIVQGGDGSLSIVTRIGRRTDVVLALRSVRVPNAAPKRQVVAIRLADGQVTPLVDSEGAAAVGAGYLLLPRTGGLFALPFDTERLQITGEPIRLGSEPIWDPPTGIVALAVNDTGLMAWRPETSKPMQFEWLDRAGRSLGTVGPPDLYGAFDLSPDGTRMVARLPPTPEHPQGALQLFDITRGVVSPITTPPGLVSDPIWTVDGSRILYRLGNAVMRQSPYATEAEMAIDGQWYPDAVSSDGRWLLAGRPERGGAFGLFAVPADGKGDPLTIETGFTADEGEFSPDRTMVAYHSSRTGRAEVYLTPFPPTGERWQVSPEGGVQPHWSADGRWLYYASLTGELQRVPVSSALPQRTGRPEAVFDLGTGPPSTTLEQYALAGDRVLVLRQAKDAPRETVAVVSNWTSLLPTSAEPR